MYRAMTFIESVITLTLMVIAFYFLSPVLFHIHSYRVLENEISQLKSFLYRVQSQARFRQQNYQLSMAEHQGRWCIIAVVKKTQKQTACHCGYLASCALQDGYVIHRSLPNIVLNARRIYPSVLANLDGKSGEISATCLNVAVENHRMIIQIQRNGVINVLPQNARSQCKETT